MTRNLVRRRGWKWGAFVVAVTCFGLGVADVLPVPTVEIHWIEKSRSEAGLYMPSYEYKRGREIMLVYIGSLSCRLSIGIYRDDERTNPLIRACEGPRGFGAIQRVRHAWYKRTRH